MTAVCWALAALYAFAALAPAAPVEIRIDYSPAAITTR